MRRLHGLIKFILKQWPIFVLIGTGVLTYINTLPNGFVWDDYVNIVNNLDVRSIRIVEFFRQNTFNNGLFYRPLALLFTSLLYSMFQGDAFGHHLFQVGIHIINAVLLYILFRKFLRLSVSLFLSLIFLVHPIQVESVAFAASIVAPLSSFFGLCAILLYLSGSKNIWVRVATPLLLVASVLVKEQGILFIPIMFLAHIVLLQGKRSFLYLISVCTFAVVLYGYLRIFVGHVGLINARAAVVPVANLSIFERSITIPKSILYYLKTFLFPFNLAIDQQWVIRQVNFTDVLLPLGIIIIVLGVALVYAQSLFRDNRSRFNVYLFFLGWFLLTLLFHLPFFPSDMTVADRFFYLPIVGLLGTIGVYIEQHRNLSKTFYVSCVVLILLFMGRTMVRNRDWSNEKMLYEHDLRVYDSFNIENNLGNVYLRESNYREALYRFQRSHALLPTELNTFNIGYAHDLLGEQSDAIGYYNESLTYDAYPPAEHNIIERFAIEKLSKLYLLEGQYQQASEKLTQHLHKDSSSGQLWQYLAISEYNLRHKDAALDALQEAKKYLPTTDTSSDYLYSLMVQGSPIVLIRSK